MRLRILPLALALTLPLAAQQTPPTKPARPATSESVVVPGSFGAVAESESSRSVALLDSNPVTAPTFDDLLRSDTAVALQQRGVGGTQADISIGGTTFEQTLVLLNGLRVNDVETSHFNLDLPLPPDALKNVEILHGAGSTLYGSDAIGGVVDAITARPDHDSVLLRTDWASFTGQSQALRIGIVRANWNELLAGLHAASHGFTVDRDYSARQGSSETRFTTGLGQTDLLLAASDRPYGANLFYGSWDSFERTKSWFTALNQQFNPHTLFAFGYRRHTDEFLLFRENPAAYENNHVDQSWQGALRRSDQLARNLRVYYGIEADADQIRSTNLGNHGRNDGAGYLQAEWRSPQRASVSAGVREQILSGGTTVFAPALSASLWLPRSVKLHASAGRGFRRPTFLDLYYSDPLHTGNPNLKPESSWGFDGGADWYPDAKTTASATVFYNRLHDTIDYDKPAAAAASAPYVAANLETMSYTGVSAAIARNLHKGRRIALTYTGISASQPSLAGYVSIYSANYAVHNAAFEYSRQMERHHGLFIRTRVAAQQHVGQTAYAVWDLDLAQTHGHFRPYIAFANLANLNYAEVLAPSAVPMAPRTITGGFELDLHRPHWHNDSDDEDTGAIIQTAQHGHAAHIVR